MVAGLAGSMATAITNDLSGGVVGGGLDGAPIPELVMPGQPTPGFKIGPWDVPDDVYHNDRRTISHSMMKTFWQSPTRYCEQYIQRSLVQPTTKALDTGTALHMALLEPEKFLESFVCRPENSPRNTAAGKERYAQCQAENPGKIILDREDWFTVDGVAQTVAGNKTIRDLLTCKGGINERACCWIDPENRLQLRGKQDRWLPDGLVIIDLKSMLDDPSPEAFGKVAYNLSYYTQAVWYTEGISQAYDIDPAKIEFLVIAAGKKPPYEVGIYRFDKDYLELGADKIRKGRLELAECMGTKDWAPGWSSAPYTVQQPFWTRRR